ncbi:F510_1955 family glycosylhydrolase [Amycolatopsis thermoflava]|uniref:F510_1955 family glycosylhydrolase n=1 Tax=Amycolatopsis thermoflava TaxID=84480 RepID=UPI003823C398
MRARLYQNLLLAAAVLMASACAAPSTGVRDGTPPSGTTLAHVHGLGVDPADGMLYAASHYGLFKLPPGGAPERVGPVQDVMGFTVAGPGHFLASGHPGTPSDAGPHLGLIETTDAGQTWRNLSLGGAADFHALEAKHDVVFGYDSQSRQILTSADKRSWEPRARLALRDFAVDPARPEVLIANTADGLTRSADGGATFTPLPDAPDLVFVEWPATGTLLGSDPNNTLYLSTDGGGTWTRQGQAPGPPGAFAAISPTELYIATESAILYSSEGGRSFTVRQPLS